VASYVPRRGDIVWLTFQPQAGHEQAGRRPALVLSPERYNDRVGLGLFCPLTSKVKGYPFEVELPESLGGGAILADQVKSLDWRARRADFKSRLSLDLLAQVNGKLRSLLDDAT